MVGDLTYKEIELDLLSPKYINQQMLNQVEFRKRIFTNLSYINL